MKKTLGLVFLLVSMLIGIGYLKEPKSPVYMIDGEYIFSIKLRYDMGNIEIHPWWDEDTGNWYVFFPSFVEDKVVDCEKIRRDFYIDGERVRNQFVWEDERSYEITYGENTMQVVFMEDANLSTLFIETESGSNELMRSAKENIEKGYIVSLDNHGQIEYRGNIFELSGHGNAWQFYDKRAYDIKLNNKATLAGLDGSNQWKLIHMSNDGDKIHSRLGYDIADILGAPYTPKRNWVNVYFNGEYHGMYLLVSAVRNQDVLKTEDAIVLEKDIPGRYDLEEHVISESGNPFVIHRPLLYLMDEEQKEERKGDILQMVQQVEDTIESGEFDDKIFDVNSFVIQYLVEEITLNLDGFETSSFMYWLSDKSPLYAGPAWDYDGTFGECLQVGDSVVNPAGTVLDGEANEWTWYHTLLDNPQFVSLVAKKYEECMPQIRQLFEETLDIYAEYTRTSFRNDSIRWDYFATNPKTGTYQTWDNNFRYLKYFSANRYNALMDRWTIDGEKMLWEGNGQQHKVQLLYSGQIEEILVDDGETLDLSRMTDIYQKDGYNAKIAYSEEEYSKFLPVLEDFAIKFEKDPSVSIADDVKQVLLPVDMFAVRQNYVSVFVIDAEGNATSILNAEPFVKDICLEFEMEENGTVAMYVFADESATTVIDEVMIEY